MSAAEDAAARHAAARCTTCITIDFVIAISILQGAVMERSSYTHAWNDDCVNHGV